MNKLNISSSSQIGCVRSNNEDMILVVDKFLRNDTYETNLTDTDKDRFVIGLADGMGGHNGGEVASSETLSNLHFYINDIPANLSNSDFNEIIINWLISINTIIELKGKSNKSLSNMGTTLVAIIYYEDKYYWVNCGDSRLYRVRDGIIKQLTVDHSLNTITGQSRHSNVLTNCIGAGCKTSYADIYEFTDDILSDDVFILCSDGLSDMISDELIQSIINSGGDATSLCREAINAGGYDNVSVCVLKVSK